MSLAGPAVARPPLSEGGEVLRRPGVAVVFACGFLFSLALGGGWASDRFLGGRRRPGIVATAITAALAFTALALGERVPAAAVARLKPLVRREPAVSPPASA